MQIVFNLPYVFNPFSSKVDNAYALKALLDCMIELNIAFLRCHNAKPLYQSGVVYGRTDWWEPIGALYQRGYGDCKSLATALIAEYRLKNKSAIPAFRWVRNNCGNCPQCVSGKGDKCPNAVTDFHILVQTNEGYEDPSKILGMGADEVAKFYGPISRFFNR